MVELGRAVPSEEGALEFGPEVIEVAADVNFLQLWGALHQFGNDLRAVWRAPVECKYGDRAACGFDIAKKRLQAREIVRLHAPKLDGESFDTRHVV